MPLNRIVINGNIEYEVPDSYMGPLEAYFEMVREKTALDDVVPEEVPESRQEMSDGPGQMPWEKDPVPVQNDSVVQALVNESLHMVSELKNKLEPVLLPDDGTTPDAREASPVVETIYAIHGHLEKLIKRVDL